MIDLDQILLVLEQIIPQTKGLPGLMQALVFLQNLLLQLSGGGGLPGGFGF